MDLKLKPLKGVFMATKETQNLIKPLKWVSWQPKKPNHICLKLS